MILKDFVYDEYKFDDYYVFSFKFYKFCVVVFFKKCFYMGLLYN